jgi:alpha-L-fucosidase
VRGDGTIDEKEDAIVDQIAAWNGRNGEAIFGTRPWRRFGEGPTRPPAGSLNEQDAKPFTARDIRFTQKDGALYAIFLEWPERETAIAALGANQLPDAVIERVELLGGSPLQFRRDGEALRVTLPRADLFVPAIRINGRGLA